MAFGPEVGLELVDALTSEPALKAGHLTRFLTETLRPPRDPEGRMGQPGPPLFKPLQRRLGRLTPSEC